MKTSEVAVIDYGMGNLLSVRRGLEHCGATVVVTSDHDEILAARRVVLPGVGAFADGMAELRRRGLDAVVRELADRATPLLAICLGMQMLLDESEEFGTNNGLGLIPGRVIQVPATRADGRPQKIPHIGWNSLEPAEGRKSWEGTCMREVRPGSSAYFVHSFMAAPSSPEHRIADCLYGGVPVSAAIGHASILGCQFHPEKSGEVGLAILRAFLA